MGTSRYASGSIAAVGVVDAGGRDARIDVLEGEGLNSDSVGNNTEALDYTVHTQFSVRSVRAVHFGAKVAQLPVAKVKAIVAAMRAAVAAGNSFAVVLADSETADNINVLAVPDWQALGGRYYTRGGISGGYMRDVTFRFVSTGTP